ncbi:MAG: hypothetical protein ACE5NC_05380 [Anaerolineae bacterium]
MTWKPISMDVPDRGGRLWLHGSERDVTEELMRTGTMTAPALGRATGFSPDYAELLCQSLAKKGAVTQVGGKKIYDLPAAVREQLQAKT